MNLFKNFKIITPLFLIFLIFLFSINLNANEIKILAKVNNNIIEKFANIEQFIDSFAKFKIHFGSVLIKGSRSMKLEKLIPFFKSL